MLHESILYPHRAVLEKTTTLCSPITIAIGKLGQYLAAQPRDAREMEK